ncbi:hypothetical protein ASF00_15450 [Sphingomonas sp. Leaf34]|uniref:hypothetical protein n=1 Tax=Sphingomonas sp. Leaf34 TaxID=1736216 RepID=UPI0006F57190|nr:hypothetical protein [Sphingomonas sp. Leaf34]KQN24248.1 hypothetical protein ASF00_15450 [Sphingomonas sp. Leaf34]
MPNDTPLRLVKDEPLFRLGQPGPETDMFLPDVAREVMVSAIETAQHEQGNTVEATETAARILLLAAADLWWGDIEVAGRGMLLSTMLLAGLDELREQLIAPPAPADEAGVRAKLDAAARAGLRGDDAPPRAAGDGVPLVVPQGMGGFTRSLLAACTPPKRGGSTEGDGDAPPPLAA